MMKKFAVIIVVLMLVVALFGATKLGSIATPLGVGIDKARGVFEVVMSLSDPDALNVNLSKGVNITDGGNVGISTGVSSTGSIHGWMQARNNLGVNNTAYPIQLNPLGGGVQIGTDTAMTAAPRMIWSAFMGVPITTGQNIAFISVDKAITVTRMMGVALHSSVGCTQSITLSNNGSAPVVTMNMPAGSASYDAGAVSANYPAGATLLLVFNAGTGCTTNVDNINISALYKMQ